MRRKQSRTVSIIMLCFMLTVLLSGCWDRTEPKTMALVSSAIYDLKDDGNYQITVEITNPTTKEATNESTSGKSTSITYMGENLSIPESGRSITRSIDKSIFSSHTKVRFLSEKFAKKDVAPVFDYLLRSYHLDENPLLMVIKDEDPSKIYTCEIGLSETVGGYMESISKSLPSVSSKCIFVDAREFIKDYYRDGKQPVAGTVKIVKNKAPSSNTQEESKKEELNIECEGLAAFKDTTLVGFLDGVEVRAYNFIVNDIKTALISIPNEIDYTVFMVDRSKSKIETFYKDGEISAKVSPNVYLSAIQQGGTINVTQMDSIKLLQQQLNELLEKELSDTIKKAQTELKSDIFGFGDSMHIQHPEQWKQLRFNWDEEFSKAKIDVKMDSSIRRTGQIKKAFREEEK